jgi:hypothetical protein
MADANGIDRTGPPDRDATIRALCDDLGAISRGLVFIVGTLRDRREADTMVIREYSELLSRVGNDIEKIRGALIQIVGEPD